MSLRPGRYDHKRLLWALAISLSFHLLCYGTYEFSRKVLPGWLERMKILAALAHQLEIKKPTPPPPPPSDPPMVFVEVNPAAATPEPPKDAKFYSSQNSKAADAENAADKDMPKITGNQEHVAKAEDAPRKNVPLQPTPAPPSQEQPEERAKPKPAVGDLAMAKPTPESKPDTGTAEHSRPRTIVEAKMRQPPNQLPGQKMKQDGGVRRHLAISSFDAKATSFGAYDSAFIDAVQTRWYDLLDSQQFALNRTGKVVLRFNLNYDGRITDMHQEESTVGDTLAYVCQLAVTDPAPYLKWPSDMRREIGDTRTITFTFYY